AAVLAAGLGVQALGVAFPADAYLRMATQVKNGSGGNGWFAAWDQVHFMPQFSPLVGHAYLLTHFGKHEPAKEPPKVKAPPDPPPWVLLQPSAPRLETELAQTRLDWWALEFRRVNVKTK